jgi:hypothetical protein
VSIEYNKQRKPELSKKKKLSIKNELKNIGLWDLNLRNLLPKKYS